MPLPYTVGDRVKYIGPQLLGKPWTGIVVRLPVPHLRPGTQAPGIRKREVNGADAPVSSFPLGPMRPGGERHATDDRVMVRVQGAEGKTKHPIRPVRPEHLAPLTAPQAKKLYDVLKSKKTP
jgi:hypothetical protein